ncbi:3-hydroxyacyl-CoA dehydrogenase family protein [Chloroflexota bacterium]
MKRVGVVGCGQMGGGIAQVCAQAGYDVVVSEIDDELLKKGLGAIGTNLAKGVAKERITQPDMDATLARLKGTTSIKDFSDCDLVIEAAIEKMELKKQIFAELDKVCRKETILATNTSCLSVIDVAGATGKLDKVLGIHFFNPPQVMKLVEVVRSIATSEDTLKTSKSFAESVGKTVVIAPDIPGFIVNRLLMPFLVNAIRMLEAGIASKEDIDNGIQRALNHPMGPLTLADFIGNDTNLFILDAIYEVTRNPKYIAPVLLRKMVAAGWLGVKTGKGFYDYSQGEKK